LRVFYSKRPAMVGVGAFGSQESTQVGPKLNWSPKNPDYVSTRLVELEYQESRPHVNYGPKLGSLHVVELGPVPTLGPILGTTLRP
jgi:hypothetical protein